MKNKNTSLQKLEEHNENMTTILNAVDALIYVSDIETQEVIFMNQHATDHWDIPGPKEYWQTMATKQSNYSNCSSDDNYNNEFEKFNKTNLQVIQISKNGRWYQCHSCYISWADGRMVRLDIATDITNYVEAENKLKIAKENADKLAHTDFLTKIRNRRAFFREGIQVLNLAKRYYHSTSIIMMDIDYFKQVNDAYGHSIGDKVLIEFSETIRKNIREVDILGRIGGEEFALILPESTIDEALKITEKLRQRISNMNFDNIAHQLAISSSFGVATAKAGCIGFEKLLSLADTALYTAKNKGRNRVESHSEPTFV